jgi:ribosomal protein S18 acetylase RimI-like enzyme
MTNFIVSHLLTQIDCDTPNFAIVVIRPVSHIAPVGYLRLELDGKAGFIHSLYVAPDFQQQGAATMLCQHAIDLCKELKYESVGLGVKNGNEPALALYKKLGFVRYIAYSEEYTQYIKTLVS